jgi:peroxisome-assembly ATPase
MMLRRIIDYFYSRHGVVTFMTSNRPPDDLYQDGVQRKSFLPCIEQIKQNNRVVCLNSDIDYRKIDRPSSGNYFFPPAGKSLKDKEVKAQAENHALKWFEYFGKGRQTPQYNTHLEVWGRPVLIPKSIPGKVAQFTFDELCMHPLSAADYLEITKIFPGIVVTDVPMLSTRQTDVTRRFITFLDAAYDTKTKLAATAAKPFDALFTGADLSVIEQAAQEAEKSLGEADTDSDFLSNVSFFRGEEEKFAYARTLSRLKQMSSKQWLDQLVTE